MRYSGALIGALTGALTGDTWNDLISSRLTSHGNTGGKRKHSRANRIVLFPPGELPIARQTALGFPAVPPNPNPYAAFPARTSHGLPDTIEPTGNLTALEICPFLPMPTGWGKQIHAILQQNAHEYPQRIYRSKLS